LRELQHDNAGTDVDDIFYDQLNDDRLRLKVPLGRCENERMGFGI
jgi:hypothetical protein